MGVNVVSNFIEHIKGMYYSFLYYYNGIIRWNADLVCTVTV